MILQLDQNTSQKEVQAIKTSLDGMNVSSRFLQTQKAKYIIAITREFPDIRKIAQLPHVKDVHRLSDNYKLVSSKWKIHRTVVELNNGIRIGDYSKVLMAGPCSLETEEQIEHTAEQLRASNIGIMRGGAFKPRSSPYSFRGLGLDGLKMMHSICAPKNIAIITEVMDAKQIEKMYPYVDIFQVGARNSQNFDLLDALGKTDKPVMIKRGISGRIEELLQSAEYVFSGGNEQIILCERGIRSYESAYRNTFDINAIPILIEKSHLPVIADPSHGIGIRRHVPAITKAALAAGAHGAIVEAHPHPEKAVSDGAQSLNLEELHQLNLEIEKMF